MRKPSRRFDYDPVESEFTPPPAGGDEGEGDKYPVEIS
jgi:hypothetical protein